jgi:gamma-glutamyl:cysteine ligase YbdK (ATP-grasp superfamily)
MAVLGLFEGYGIEIEYMLVDAESLNVRPWADRLLRDAAGSKEYVADHDDGDIGWSNELVAHVLEFKTARPVPSLDGVDASFDESIDRAQLILAGYGAKLMPSGSHPWMSPAQETRLWTHEGAEVYRTYDRIFHCRRHGWANLQAVHLNLPFSNDEELGRLLAAARMVLPLLPALAASSPFCEGRATRFLDTRLEHYRTNSTLVPAMAGGIIPEPIFTEAEYRARVLGRIDAELLEFDHERVLVGHEWINARGAIARFDRMALELRLIDTQECPRADLAIAAAAADAMRALVEERWSSWSTQKSFPHAPLAKQLDEAIIRGPAARVLDPEFSAAFGAPLAKTLGEVWAALLTQAFSGPVSLGAALELIQAKGTLAERILAAAGRDASRARLAEVYDELCACLASGRLFGA